MKQLAYTLYLLMVLCLTSATFIEKYYGTQTVKRYIYDSEWFIAFWVIIVITAMCHFGLQKMHKNKAIFLLHFSFISILTGACVTHFTSKQGIIHLRTNQYTYFFTNTDTRDSIRLPFAMKLDTFAINYYPGTKAPSDYISYVSIANERMNGKVSMNNIFSYHNYRFYQTSFDENHKGSWLTVNYDPWGIPITYAGYLLLLFGMCWVILSPKGKFRKLLAHPLLKRMGIFLAIACCITTTTAQNTLSKKEADTYRSKQIIYNNRIAPLNTLARDVVMKLSGKSSYKNYTPEQVLIGWMFYPEKWEYEPMIRIKDKELQHLLHIKEYASLADFFTSTKEYRLQKYWNKLHQSGEESSLLKAITKADEKIAIISMLQQRTLIKSVPKEGVKRLTNLQIQAELLYNQINFSAIVYRINLTTGLICFFLFIFFPSQSLLFKKIIRITCILLLLSFVFHTISICLRTYIAGRLPLSNGYETMQFIAWSAMLIALLLRKRFIVALIFGFLLSGFTLLVASLIQMNPQITPLMPVLSSPLLSLHVSLIMFSYTLFGFMFFNGLTALSLAASSQKLKKNSLLFAWKIERLTLLSRIFLYPATFLLGAGIFIGAIWANISWGRYWSWDPKEVWALITFMIYSLAFHTQSLKKFKQPLFFHLFIVLAFSTLLMTYFGVNYFLGGMHSYANG